MPVPARTTTLLLKRVGCQAAPRRGPMPHWRPVRVVLLTPPVPLALLPAMTRPGLAGVGAGVVVVERGIEVEDAAVLLGEAAVPVVTNAGGEGEVGFDLELVLEVEAELVGAVVT